MSIVAFANAKINLTLDCLTKRPDGYHDIDTVMQSVSLFDTLFIDITEGDITVSTNIKNIENEDNLVYKAISLFFDKTDIPAGANCHIIKRIPLVAGLGGGSADAAAALLTLNKYYDYPLNDEELLDISIKLGADVPFFLVGGTVRCTGIGEELYALPYIGDYNVLLVKSGNKTSTKTMYEKIDKSVKTSQNYTKLFLENFEKNKPFKTKLKNCFLDVLDDKQSKTELINEIALFKAVASGLTGSGPTVFGLFDNFSSAFLAYNHFKDKGYEVYLCKTEEQGIIVE